MVVIPKHNKVSFDSPKPYRPIVLLNTIEKLFKKMIGECLQFHTISNSFIHPSQLRGLKQRSTMDTMVALTHIIQSGWVKNLTMSILAFNIAQFFLSLNHQLLSLILNKMGLNYKILTFFKNYLVGRKTKYLWNNFISPSFNANVGVRQGSALSLILSTLYLCHVFLSLENRLKILKIPISIISFVNNGLFISQNKSISHFNANIFCSYNIILSLLIKCSLVVEYGKTDIFHFSRSHRAFNPPLLDLSALGGPVLLPKETWRYLGFIFDWKLTFRSHIDFYANKVVSTVKCMKLLGNLSRGINPLQKRRLYRCCALSIALYNFPLWYYNKAPTCYHLNILWKMQQGAAHWISGVFQTSPTLGIEAISGLIPIHLYLKKLYRRFLLWESFLPSNHIINNILSSNRLQKQSSHNASIDYLIAKQRLHLKSPLINVDDKYNKFFPSFSFFNEEFKPGNHLIYLFLDCISFHPCSSNTKKHIEKLDDIAFRASSNPFSTIVVSNASIKNHIATSIAYIHSLKKPVVKTIHRAINITTTKAELFTIWCGINQAVASSNVNHIVVITDSLHATKRILNSSVHPYQIHSVAISQELREFFSKNTYNYIKFWDCPSKQKWLLHYSVDKDTKIIVSTPSFPCKSSWNFCRKTDCDSILSQWRMLFQAADSKGKNFLDLLDDDLDPIKLSSMKGGL